jgi:LysR family glycine cleavage system transcriptional activator
MPTTRGFVPLNALRAFEVAARHSSFVIAAKELNVTPAAISHHVKVLEDFIGTALFRRGNRSIELTAAGRACFQPLEKAFHDIEEATLRLRSSLMDGPLRVRVSQCFASKWLLPRIDAFQRANPEIDLQISVSSQIYEFRFDEMDVIVRMRAGDFRGFVAEPILTEHVMPVCSPDFLRRHGPVSTPRDLARLPLIHDDNLRVIPTFPDWRMWFEAAGVMDADTTRGNRFEASPMAAEAAMQGRGVCLGRSAIIAADLAAGRLVRMLDWLYPITHAYFVIYPEGTLKGPKVRRFRDWLLREAAADAANVVLPLSGGAPVREASGAGRH